MLRGGGLATSLTSGEPTLIRGTKLEPTGELDFYLRALSSGHAMLLKEYHDAIRRQKNAHWQEFLEDDTNIWQAVRFLAPRDSPAFDKVPPLERPGQVNHSR